MDSINEQTLLHLTTGTLRVDGLVRENLSLLEAHDRFLLCNRNLLVNMDWIASAGTDHFCLKTGERLPLRRNGRPKLREAYLAYRMRSIERGR